MFPADAPGDEVIAATILRLAAARAPATICPSEVARALAPAPAWRALMPPVREAAARLRAEGRLVATRRGEPVDPLVARGPIRLRAVAAPPGREAPGDR